MERLGRGATHPDRTTPPIRGRSPEVTHGGEFPGGSERERTDIREKSDITSERLRQSSPGLRPCAPTQPSAWHGVCLRILRAKLSGSATQETLSEQPVVEFGRRW